MLHLWSIHEVSMLAVLFETEKNKKDRKLIEASGHFNYQNYEKSLTSRGFGLAHR